MNEISIHRWWNFIVIAAIVIVVVFNQKVTAQQILNANAIKSSVLQPEQLQQDFKVFRNAIRQEHAGLYRYKSQGFIDNLFDSCFTTLDHPMLSLEYAKTIMFLVSAIEDGHTGTNIPRLLMKAYNEQEKMFPAWIYFIGEKAYVLCSRMEILPTGTEILSIQNRPVAEIRQKLLQYLPSDGKIESKKQQTLNNGAFTFLYNWIFGNNAGLFQVEYKAKTGKIETTLINAAFIKDFECEGTNVSGKKDLELELLPGDRALLSISTFDDNRLVGKFSFKEFLDSAFKEIHTKRVKKLIIDLRGNAGGTDAYGALLYAYLASKPFKYFYSIESVTQKISLRENSLLGVQHPQANAFTGEVFFLINGLSFSTTADFCAIARNNNRGRFIGEETGGGYYGNSSGEMIKIELPVSKISISIPKYKYVNDVRASKYQDRGVIPDDIILPTIEDVISRRDIQLEFAINLTGKINQ